MKKFFFTLTFIGLFLFAIPTLAYTVQSGDTMTQIAGAHNLTLQEIAELNPHIENSNMIITGRTVKTTDSTNTAVPVLEEINYHLSVDEIDLIGKFARAEALNEEKLQEKTQVNHTYTEEELDLLARLVRAEAQTEPFEGKVAVACVVLNRVESPKFPNTIKDVIYAPGQFQPITNGEIHKPADQESILAVQAALTEQRQLASGSLFFYNPAIATSRWLDSRPTTVVIGQHVFKK